MNAKLEHVNVTVLEPERTAEMICDIFGWHVRWRGPAKDGGRSIHVGGVDSYLAIYAPAGPVGRGGSSYDSAGGLNHIGIVVDDLDTTEKRVLAAGLKSYAHGDYEPGRRFYFRDKDGIEFEVVSYGRA